MLDDVGLTDVLSTDEPDEELGRAAAERLCHEWPNLTDLVEVQSVAFANGAVGRLAELIESQPALFQASRRGSELGAESLSARPFQGIVETIQNADDLDASELRIAIRRRRGNSDLLLVHDGSPVSLLHVGAMVLPWVGTKRDDPLASGRFGIGQMTLRALGGPIEVHCHPFHFRMEQTPRACSPEPAIPDLYDPARRDTLLVVPLKVSVDLEALHAFVTELGTQSVVFLKSIRRLSFFDLKLAKRTVDHHLLERERRLIQVKIRGRTLPTEVVSFSSPNTRQTYLRYMAEVPVRKTDHRRDKAESDTTQVGVSIPQRKESTGLYDRVPLPLRIAFPVGLHAQFDPDTARSTLHETSWNKHRFEELGELIGEIARDVAAGEPQRAWSVIPLDSEVRDGITDWISERFRVDVVGACHSRVRDTLVLTTDAGNVRLAELAYEESSLDQLLSDADQRALAPEYEPMRAEWRDQSGRWRAVLEELGVSHRIEATTALDLLDLDEEGLGIRDVRWFIKLADAALTTGVLDEWAEKRGVLLADGRRVEPPGTDEPRSLVYRDEPNSLSSQLGLALPIHAGYLSDEAGARRVREALEEQGWLVEAFESDRESLDLLARGEREPIRLAHEALLTLRDAFERLSDEEQRELGPRIGRSILLRGFSYTDDGTSREGWIGPFDAYLPKQIDREKDSFAVSAAQTPGLNWLSPHYAKLLKRVGGRQQLGAQRFLVRLGAQTQPRLVSPPNQVRPYVRDPRWVSPIQTWTMPALQVTEINSLGQRVIHLLGDRWSPDLEAVIANLQGAKASLRRRRAAALLAVLARGWERHYSTHAHAKAVWAYDGYWNDRGEITATWVARLASEPWLPSMTGASRAPQDLHLLTEANKLTVGSKRALYMMKVDEQIMRSPLISALRIRRGPAASAIITRLEELRDAAASGKKVEAETRTAYALLALNCPSGERTGRRPVDDITVSTLRSRFSARGSGRGIAGLLFINNQWHRPQDVRRGPPIFGRHRPFVPESQRLDPLWSTLGIDYPSSRDCLDVLRELSGAPLAARDESVVIESMRLLSAELDEMTPQLRRTLQGLPLWDGEKWMSRRPVYALEDETLADTIAAQVPIWRAGFSLEGHEKLITALGVTLLKSRDFRPVSGDARGAVSGEDLRRRFTLAVEHLRTELARRDPILYESLQIPWGELAACGLVVDRELEVATTVDGKRLIGETNAHLIHDPLTLFVRSESHLGLTEAGGRVIGELFNGDKQKVAWAWAAMWARALEGSASRELTLSTDLVEEAEGEVRLIDLKNQTEMRPGQSRSTRASGTKGAGKTAADRSIEIRKLKDLGGLQPSEGAIVNAGAKRGGVSLPARRPLRDKSGIGRPSGSRPPDSPDGEKASDGSVLPPLSEREQLAYDAVRAALRLAEGQIADLRKEVGVGADAIDEMRRFYEIKMASAAEIPNEITLTPAEVERARMDPDFFLAVVAGLEEGAGELRVRFIFDPLSRLPFKLRGDLTLSGIRDSEALEYVFRKAE